jgi:hypothetical protein
MERCGMNEAGKALNEFNALMADDPVLHESLEVLARIEAAVRSDCEINQQSYPKITNEVIEFRVQQLTRLYVHVSWTRHDNENRIIEQAMREEWREEQRKLLKQQQPDKAV